MTNYDDLKVATMVVGKILITIVISCKLVSESLILELKNNYWVLIKFWLVLDQENIWVVQFWAIVDFDYLKGLSKNGG